MDELVWKFVRFFDKSPVSKQWQCRCGDKHLDSGDWYKVRSWKFATAFTMSNLVFINLSKTHIMCPAFCILLWLLSLSFYSRLKKMQLTEGVVLKWPPLHTTRHGKLPLSSVPEKFLRSKSAQWKRRSSFTRRLKMHGILTQIELQINMLLLIKLESLLD